MKSMRKSGSKSKPRNGRATVLDARPDHPAALVPRLGLRARPDRTLHLVAGLSISRERNALGKLAKDGFHGVRLLLFGGGYRSVPFGIVIREA